MSGPYDVHLSSGAQRTYEKLPEPVRARIRKSLEQLAAAASEPGCIGGTKVKTIQGRADSFQRLRVGDHRVMYDVIEEGRVILVLGIVHRRDLERWLRAR